MEFSRMDRLVLVLLIGTILMCRDANAAERSCVPDCSGVLDLAGPRAVDELRGLAGLIRKRIEAAGSVAEKAAVLNRFYFDILKFRPEDAVNSDEGLLLESVLRNRRGTCLGLAGIYLALAKLLNLSAAAVSVPNHVFVRFEEPGRRLNVELLQAGKMYEDDWYVRVHRIPPSSIASGVFLRSLSEQEFLGEVYAMMGTLYSRRGDYSNSRVLYDAAIRNAPHSPWPRYDLGNDLMKLGDTQGAIRLYDKALALYPTDAQALNNRGMAQCRLGNTRLARRDLEAAVEADPSFVQAHANLSDLRCGSESTP
jgi:regulator of sirC expression with transglutaminase-like and TPR domain